MEFAGSNYPVEEEWKKTLNRLLPPHIAVALDFWNCWQKTVSPFSPCIFFWGCWCRSHRCDSRVLWRRHAPSLRDGPSGGATWQWLSSRCSAPPLPPLLQDLNSPAALFVCSQWLCSWERIHPAVAAQKTPFLCRGSRLVCSSAEPVLVMVERR